MQRVALATRRGVAGAGSAPDAAKLAEAPARFPGYGTAGACGDRTAADGIAGSPERWEEVGGGWALSHR